MSLMTTGRAVSRIQVVRARFPQQFGNGMVPFDTAYHAALREGQSVVQAQLVGAEALLDAYTEQLIEEVKRDGNGS